MLDKNGCLEYNVITVWHAADRPSSLLVVQWSLAPWILMLAGVVGFPTWWLERYSP
jgi:hypothetical protein